MGVEIKKISSIRVANEISRSNFELLLFSAFNTKTMSRRVIRFYDTNAAPVCGFKSSLAAATKTCISMPEYARLMGLRRTITLHCGETLDYIN